MISKDVEGNEYEVTATDLTWRPSAYGIVIHEDKILLIKESGKYHLPGGGIDLGENPETAVLREVTEETGVTVGNTRLLDIASSLFSFGAFDSPPDLQHVHSLLIYYSCEYVSMNLDDIKLDEFEKNTDMMAEWVDITKLEKIIVGTTVDWRPVVQHLIH